MEISYTLPNAIQKKFEAALASWQSENKVDRLWKKDATLWTGEDEAKWLGWLDIVERSQKELPKLVALREEIKAEKFEHALLLGMGGSSLCPEVFALTFGQQPGSPKLHIVDSTDPAQVKAAHDAVDLAKTIVVVASKSGSTLEPNILKQYFFEEMKKAVGAGKAGSHFIAITDPGSKMEQVARADNFRHIFFGDPQIGGRYSALSNFGMVAAAVAGLDVAKLLDFAAQAVAACKLEPRNNPGVLLGLILGTAAVEGSDKITFFPSPEIYDLGAWFEQLIAESTGKVGKGITPVDREGISSPKVYGEDRVFAYLTVKGKSDPATEKKVEALESAGHAVVRIVLPELYAISEQFFIWEIATAVAGTVLGINAFNQPDVEASKVETRALTDEYEKTGKLAEHTPILTDGGISLYADDSYAATLKSAAAGETLAGYIKAHLDQIKEDDYFAALAYIQMTEAYEAQIQEFRHQVRDSKKVATCLGFGPRFLHSTGQDYKGGPNTGVFLQITADHAKDLAIPDARYTFGVVIAAQAAGDLAVLQQRKRRALRVHLGADVKAGLEAISKAVSAAL